MSALFICLVTLSLDECSDTQDDVAENIETLRIERLDFIQLEREKQHLTVIGGASSPPAAV